MCNHFGANKIQILVESLKCDLSKRFLLLNGLPCAHGPDVALFRDICKPSLSQPVSMLRCSIAVVAVQGTDFSNRLAPPNER
jgi:hypothetical protein